MNVKNSHMSRLMSVRRKGCQEQWMSRTVNVTAMDVTAMDVTAMNVTATDVTAMVARPMDVT